MSTVQTALRRGTQVLRESSDSPRLDAEMLLGTVLGRSRVGLVIAAEEAIAAA